MMRSVSPAVSVSGAPSDFTVLYFTVLCFTLFVMVTLQLFPKDVNTMPKCPHALHKHTLQWALSSKYTLCSISSLHVFQVLTSISSVLLNITIYSKVRHVKWFFFWISVIQSMCSQFSSWAAVGYFKYLFLHPWANFFIVYFPHVKFTVPQGLLWRPKIKN